MHDGFLVYYVYNVYESSRSTLRWRRNGRSAMSYRRSVAERASMTVTLGRYRLTKDSSYAPTGRLHIDDSCQGINNTDYNATYTVLGPNGYTQTVHYSSSGMTLTGLWAGEYTVVKNGRQDNCLIDPLQETRFVRFPVARNGDIHYDELPWVGSQDDIIKGWRRGGLS